MALYKIFLPSFIWLLSHNLIFGLGCAEMGYFYLNTSTCIYLLSSPLLIGHRFEQTEIQVTHRCFELKVAKWFWRRLILEVSDALSLSFEERNDPSFLQT